MADDLEMPMTETAMPDDVHFYEPRNGHGLRHNPFKAIVAPRPIGWIGSQDGSGRRNLAPYSFFNALCDTPPIVGFSSSGWKDSVRNVAETKVFTWNLATRALAEPMNASSATVAEDEFDLAGLASVPGTIVAAPRVALTPVAFECRLTQLVQLQAADGRALEQWLVLGEVVGVHIRTAFLRDGVYDTAAARPILRGGGAATYFEIGPDARFEMARPR